MYCAPRTREELADECHGRLVSGGDGARRLDESDSSGCQDRPALSGAVSQLAITLGKSLDWIIPRGA